MSAILIGLIIGLEIGSGRAIFCKLRFVCEFTCNWFQTSQFFVCWDFDSNLKNLVHVQDRCCVRHYEIAEIFEKRLKVYTQTL